MHPRKKSAVSVTSSPDRLGVNFTSLMRLHFFARSQTLPLSIEKLQSIDSMTREEKPMLGDKNKTDEFSRIASIEAQVGPAGARTLIGIGDDTAVVRPSQHPMLLCTDAMVENVHFDRRWISARDLGHKALAACLSDLAAMNGHPLHALFSLALPKTVADSFLDEFFKGASALAQETGCDIIGGDLTSSPGPIFIDVSCVGEAEHPIQRGGASPGDWLAVSGHPGDSAAGLLALQSGLQGYDQLKRAHLKPRPRFDLLPALSSPARICTSMIDISDGLSSELHHLARRSGVGFEVEEAHLPLSEEARALAETVRCQALDWALSGGEDYELLVTLDAALVKRAGGPPPGFTLIGRVVQPDQGLSLVHANGRKSKIEATGFNHFADTILSRGPLQV